MNKNIFLIAVIGFLLVNCTSNTIMEKPDNLISKDKMADVITDMLIAEGAGNIRNLKEQRHINYFPFVYEKYKIDSVQFQESNLYYTSRIDDYDEILANVEKKLKTLKDEFDTQRKVQDSLTKLKRPSKKISNEKTKPNLKRP